VCVGGGIASDSLPIWPGPCNAGVEGFLFRHHGEPGQYERPRPLGQHDQPRGDQRPAWESPVPHTGWAGWGFCGLRRSSEQHTSECQRADAADGPPAQGDNPAEQPSPVDTSGRGRAGQAGTQSRQRVRWDTESMLALTSRTTKPGCWPRQVAFPGGCLEHRAQVLGGAAWSTPILHTTIQRGRGIA
jgi:hypothetical protein